MKMKSAEGKRKWWVNFVGVVLTALGIVIITGQGISPFSLVGLGMVISWAGVMLLGYVYGSPCGGDEPK